MTRLLIVCCIIFGVIYLLPLGTRPLITPDEARYGAIPAEMIATGSWVVPHLNGIRYFEKPVLGYWAIAASEMVFGPSAWSIRLPSALATGFAALCLVLFASRLRLRRETGWLAAIVFFTMIEVLIGGTTAILDALFSAAITGTITFFFMAETAPTSASRFKWLVLFGAFCGLSFLIKGFLGLAIPCMVIAPYLIWMRRWRDLFVLPWLPMFVAVIVVAPWAIAVHLEDGDFWHYFFWVEHVNRFIGGAEAQHPEPFWFFIPILAAGSVPWLFSSPLAFSGLMRRRLREPWLRYLLCWLLIPFAFFSMSSGKLPTYILPCFAPLAILIAVGLLERFERATPRRTLRWIIPDIVLVVAAFGCLIIWAFDLLKPPPWGESGQWRWGIFAIGLLAWAGMDWLATAESKAVRRVVLMGLSPVLMFAAIPLLLPTGWMNGYKAPEAFLHEHGAPLRDPDAIIVSDSQLMHAVNWFYGRYDVVMFGYPGEVEWGIESMPERQLDGPGLIELIETNAAHRPVVVLLRRSQDLEAILKHPGLPEPVSTTIGRQIALAVFGPGGS